MLYYKKASVFFIKFGRDHKGRAFRCNLLFLKKKTKGFPLQSLTQKKHPNIYTSLVMFNLKNLMFWKTENKLESKKNFHNKIEKYYLELAENHIPTYLINELINRITSSQYDTYNRFWKQYPKSRKRYSKLKIEDLEHPFTHYEITDFLKQKEPIYYIKFSKILLKMNDEEFSKYVTKKHQYETK